MVQIIVDLPKAVDDKVRRYMIDKDIKIKSHAIVELLENCEV